MKKQLTALACAACLCAGLSLPARAAQYSDVAAGAWYAEAVQEVSESGYMTGAGDGTFAPEGTVTRATVVTVLWRLAGSPAPLEGEAFPDVAEGVWYGTAAAWAKGMGIAVGDGKGQFRPEAAVTRQELAVFLTRYDKYRGLDVAEGTVGLFSDAEEIADWALDGMKHAVGMGLLQGSNGCIDPGGAATRGQLAVILQRLTTPAMG